MTDLTPEELNEGEELLKLARAYTGFGDCNSDAWADWCHEHGEALIAGARKAERDAEDYANQLMRICGQRNAALSKTESLEAERSALKGINATLCEQNSRAIEAVDAIEADRDSLAADVAVFSDQVKGKTAALDLTLSERDALRESVQAHEALQAAQETAAPYVAEQQKRLRAERDALKAEKEEDGGFIQREEASYQALLDDLSTARDKGDALKVENKRFREFIEGVRTFDPRCDYYATELHGDAAEALGLCRCCGEKECSE